MNGGSRCDTNTRILKYAKFKVLGGMALRESNYSEALGFIR